MYIIHEILNIANFIVELAYIETSELLIFLYTYKNTLHFISIYF